jgi:hypothetical protein
MSEKNYLEYVFRRPKFLFNDFLRGSLVLINPLFRILRLNILFLLIDGLLSLILRLAIVLTHIGCV